MQKRIEILKEFISSLKNYSSTSIDTGFGFERSYKLTEEQLCNLIEYASLPKEQSVTDQELFEYLNSIDWRTFNSFWDAALFGAKAVRDGQIPKK